MLVPAFQLGFNLGFVVYIRSVIKRQEAAHDPSVATLWQRADKLLAELAAQNPQTLTCFHEGSTVVHARDCHVNLVLSDGLALWIGTVACGGWGPTTDEATEVDIEPSADSEARPARQEAPEEATVRRDECWCTIHVSGDFLTTTTDVLERGVRAYLQTFCPSLAQLPIQWLDENMSKRLAQEIRYRLRHSLD